MAGENSDNIVRFGVFEVDLRARELRRQGSKIQLQDQPFQVLAMLLEKPGQLVTREELRARIWPNGVFVDFDKSLSKAIHKIREALGDSAENSRFIETLPKRGYRFLPAVESLQSGTPAELPPPMVPAAPRPRRSFGAPLRVATGILLALVAGGAWFVRSRPRTPETPVVTPVTSDLGVAGHPSFSPDGNQIVYYRLTSPAASCWECMGVTSSLYVKIIGAYGPPRRLTTAAVLDFSPAWSPDGRYIAFLRSNPHQGGRATVMRIPLTGSPEQALDQISTMGPDSAPPQLAWLPDGQRLVIVDRSSPAEPNGLFLLSVDTRKKHRLTRPPADAGDDFGPAVSPDGHWLAFSRGNLGVSHIFLQELSGEYKPIGEPKQITFESQPAANLAWMPDGRSIVFASGPTENTLLWRIAVSRGTPGTPERLPFAGDEVGSVAISPNGRRLVFSRGGGDGFEIWRLEAPTSGVPAKPAKLIFSTKTDEDPQYSPDGKRIAFKSTRSGRFEIWMGDSDGSNLTQLTSSLGPDTANPRWSPDGQKILFNSNPDGHEGLFVMSSQGGPPKRVARGLSDYCSFSRDGRWIYFVSDRTGQPQIWKMPAQATMVEGNALQVTRNGAVGAIESPDGKYLYCLKQGRQANSLTRIPVGGGEETPVLPSVFLQNYAVAEEGIYFIPGPVHGQFSLQFLSFSSGKIVRMADIGDPASILAVSPGPGTERRSILFTQLRPGNWNLMLMENFR